MSNVKTRQPTIQEAVEIVLGSKTRAYRKLCLDFWRDLFGEEFVLMVEQQVRARWKK